MSQRLSQNSPEDVSAEGRQVYDSALEQPKTASASQAAVERALALSQHFSAQKDYQRALEPLEPLVNQALELSDAVRADLLHTLAALHRQLNHSAKVLEYGVEALELYKQLGNDEALLDLHGHLGFAYTRFHVCHTALEHYLQQARLLEAKGASLSECYVGIGWIHDLLGNQETALQYLQHATILAQEEGKLIVEGRALGNTANVYGRLKQFEKALALHRKAKMIFERLGDTHRSYLGHANIGNVYLKLGQLDKAIDHFEETLAYLEGSCNVSLTGWTETRLGSALFERNPDDAQAEMRLEHGLQKMLASGIHESVDEVYLTLSKLYRHKGELEQALDYHQRYAETKIKWLEDLNEKRVQALSIQHKVEQMRQEKEIYQLKNVELARAIEKLEELSTRDGLTGLYNRRYLDGYLSKAFLGAQLAKQPLTVLISDIDNFKAVNDSLSHATGDEVLRRVAHIFNDNTWGADVIARYGGEEFVIVFKETPLANALSVAEKLRREIERYPWYNIHTELAVTVSIGLCGDLSLVSHEQMLAVADDKLYEAKRTGKNKVVS